VKRAASPHILSLFFKGYVITYHLDDVYSIFYFVGGQLTDGHGAVERNKGNDSIGKRKAARRRKQ
jgi:hypothetical protein